MSVDAALAWAADPAKSPSSCAERLTAVRGFARYLRSFDDAHQVPPRSLLPLGGQRRVPYLLSPAEVVTLMVAARRLVPRPFGAAMETLIGLLATTGLRPGEAYALGRGDVDFEAPAVAVGAYKPGGCRILPLHPSAAEALRSYASERDKALPGSAKFFAFCGERPGATFSHLLEHAGVAAPPGRRPPRLYDLRHSFAVSTLVSWYGQGADVRPRLPVLSAYMGHKKPKETYWYLQAAPSSWRLPPVASSSPWEKPHERPGPGPGGLFHRAAHGQAGEPGHHLLLPGHLLPIGRLCLGTGRKAAFGPRHGRHRP